MGRLALILHSNGQSVTCSEVRDRVDVVVAVIRDVQIPNAVAHHPIFNKVYRLLFFPFDDTMNRLVRERKNKSCRVDLVTGWLNLSVLRFRIPPRDHRVTTEDLTMIALDYSKCRSLVVALLVKNRA